MQPPKVHLKGRSLVCERRCAASRAGRLNVLGQFGHLIVLRSEGNLRRAWGLGEPAVRGVGEVSVGRALEVLELSVPE